MTYPLEIRSSPVHILPKYQYEFLPGDYLIPYRANIRGCVPAASLNMIGVCGLFFFIVGYARDRNVLLRLTVSCLGASVHSNYVELLPYRITMF